MLAGCRGHIQHTRSPALGWESSLGTQEVRAGGDMLEMPRAVPAWGQLWGLSARTSVVAINNRDVLGGHLQPGCDP